jgi:hypothetical protein
MPSLADQKLITSDYTGHLIAELQDNPADDGLSAAALKAKFDYLVVSVIGPRINAIIDALAAATDGNSGADNIGSTAITGVTGATVQAQLESIKALIDSIVAATVESLADGSITDAKLSAAGTDILARFAAFETSHSHTMADITDLAAALLLKAAATHAHAQADVTGLVDALAAKSATTHLHTGVYQAAGSYAALAHDQAMSTITGLVAALAGKSATDHTHNQLYLAGGVAEASFGVPNIVYNIYSTPPSGAPVGTIHIQYQA